MTYCLGIKLKTGLVALADTRLTSGTETTTAKKIYSHSDGKNGLFIMTSGLRSVRDKALTYFKEVLEEQAHTEHFDKLYKIVNAFGAQLRKVAEEDKAALEKSGLHFNLYSIVGGQMAKDEELKLFLLYPEGNWVEIGETSPFVIIGNSGYGKPILNRTLHFETEISKALKTGFLSFDSTRVSANDVDYPIDVAILKPNTFQFVEHRFEEKDLSHISNFWGRQLQDSLNTVPEEWMDGVMAQLEGK